MYLLYKLRQRSGDESGFTLIELLVVILIIGILSAIAIPALLSQKSKASDAVAKEVASSAQTAIETYSTDHNGEYLNGTAVPTAAELKTYDGSLPVSEGKTAKTKGEAVLKEPIVATSDAYTVTAESTNGDTYSVERTSTGTTNHTCAVPETTGGGEHAGCNGLTNGTYGTGSW